MRRTLALMTALLLAACTAEKPSSPLPSGRYGDGSFLLVSPTVVPLDGALRGVMRTYRQRDARGRAEMRAALTPQDQYTLRDFARRSACFAMRERDRGWIVDGLTALAMLNAQFDVAGSAFEEPPALLHHAAQRIGADPVPLFAAAAAVADDEVGATLRRFPAADAKRKALATYFLEERGDGFIHRDRHPYAPARDVTGAIVRIADVLERDRYSVASLMIASALPPVWVPGAEAQLRDARATAEAGTAGNGVMAYVVEAADETAANALAAASRKSNETAERKNVGIARGNLFCIIIILQPSDETPQTLQRFVAPVSAVLDQM